MMRIKINDNNYGPRDLTMRGSMIRHKFNMEQIIHQLYPRSNMSWLQFTDRRRHANARLQLAFHVRRLRREGKIKKGWISLNQ